MVQVDTVRLDLEPDPAGGTVGKAQPCYVKRRIRGARQLPNIRFALCRDDERHGSILGEGTDNLAP